MSDSKVPSSPEPFANPPRLVAQGGAPGELIDRANLGFRSGLNEHQAFRDLDARLGAPWTSRLRWPLGLALTAAALLLLVASGRSLRGAGVSAIAPESEPRAGRGAVHAAPRAGQPFAEGATRLADGSTVRLESAAQVSLLEEGQGEGGSAKATRLALKAGAAMFQVSPQKAGASFAVLAGPYEFQALGTAFSVNAGEREVELIVVEGSVAVKRGASTLATVGAGQSWSGAAAEQARQLASEAARASAAIAPAPASAAGVADEAVEAVGETCAELARARETARAIECFAKQAQGEGLAAEVAVYQLGRLKRESGDAQGAIAVLRGYRARFPQGSLQGEVALTLVELYASTGQAREALTESERLLTTVYGRERAEQLHWLRGNLFRESLGDYVRAQAEYEQINPGARLGAEALYFTAVCLEQRGQREAARQAYEQYSLHPRATRKAAALRKLELLAP